MTDERERWIEREVNGFGHVQTEVGLMIRLSPVTLAQRLRDAMSVADRQREERVAELIAAGGLMYRAISFTSGVSLNFAADEWKKLMDKYKEEA